MSRPNPPSTLVQVDALPDGQDLTGEHVVAILRHIVAMLAEVHDQLAGRAKPYSTVEEFAELTGRSAYTVRRWISEGRIDAIRIKGTGPRGRLLIPREEMDRITV